LLPYGSLHSGANGATRCGKKDGPYTVVDWGVINKEDTVTVNKKRYHWCVADHYTGGTKNNGMYTDHNPVITMHGKHVFMRTKINIPTNSNQTLLPTLQMHPLKSLLSMISFAMHLAHRPVLLLKLSADFGKMPREMSRSKSWVE
jgi:hypothetical protein